MVLDVDEPFHTFAGDHHNPLSVLRLEISPFWSHLQPYQLLSLVLLFPGLLLSSLELCIIFLGANVQPGRPLWPPQLPSWFWWQECLRLSIKF